MTAWKSMGNCWRIWAASSAAPHPKALLDLQPLRSDLVNLEPSGMIHSQPLRQALLSLLVDMPDLNSSDHSGLVWCNLKVERLNCMLTHCRKLQRDSSSLTAIAGKLTRVQYQCLMEGLKKIKVKEEEEDEAEEEEGVLGKVYAAKRQLVPRDSDVTMGSEDIPDMFKSPAHNEAKKGGSGLEKPSPSAASGLEKPPPSGFGKAITLFLQAGIPTKAREQAACSHGLWLGKVLQACLGKGAFKKPASLGKDSLGKGTSNQRKPWVKLRQVDAKNTNPRSYICGMVEGGRMHLIVEIIKKWVHTIRPWLARSGKPWKRIAWPRKKPSLWEPSSWRSMVVDRDLHSKCLEKGTCKAKGLEKTPPSRSWKRLHSRKWFWKRPELCSKWPWKRPCT